MTTRIDPAQPADLSAMLALLTAAGLPTDGVAEHLPTMLVATDGRRVVGCVGLEIGGEAALLRSVAVDETERGTGLGGRLVRVALDLARRRAVTEVALLTTTADDYFPRFGFVPVNRDQVPTALQASAEFTGACPASARAFGRRWPDRLRARLATAADAADIAKIYNEGITDRIGTFETRLRSAADIEAWFADDRHPITLVERLADDGAQPLAFAATSLYRPRECYAGIADFSIYVARPERGHGHGRLALGELFDAARAAGFHKLVSRVFVENAASRSLCAALGFREVGIYEKHAPLDGRGRDAVIVERLL